MQVRSSAASLSRALVSEALLLSESLTSGASIREGGNIGQGGGSAAALKLSKSLRAQKKLRAGLGAARKAIISGAVSIGGGSGGLVLEQDCIAISRDAVAANSLPMQSLPGLEPMHVEQD